MGIAAPKQQTPDLFFRQDAFVLLGVGKNMAEAIRLWGRACGVFARAEGASVNRATPSATPCSAMTAGTPSW